MTIYFNSTKWARVCNSEVEARRRFGEPNAKKILQRLTETKACQNLADLSKLPTAGFHALKGTRKGQFAIYAKHPFRIVFVPQHDPIPKKEDGSVDLEQVTKICVLEVVDYHE